MILLCYFLNAIVFVDLLCAVLHCPFVIAHCICSLLNLSLLPIEVVE